MCPKISLCVALALIVVGLLLAGSASATSLPVTNSSFEDPVLGDAGYDAGPSVDEPAPPVSWRGLSVHENTNTLGIYQGAAGMSNTAGRNYLYVGMDYNYTFTQVWQPVTGATMQPGTYTLSVGVGKPYSSGTDSATIALVAGSSWMSWNSIEDTSMSQGSFTDLTATYTATGTDPELNQPLAIVLQTNAHHNGAQITAFDNIRLDFVPAPEPGTLAMLVAGLLGLLAYAWRRRR